MSQPLISIVVICKEISNFFLTKTLPAITGQSYTKWELILLPDKKSDFSREQVLCIPTWPKIGPSDKKDIGISIAKGEIIAFIDDDAYPDEDWLKNALDNFKNNEIAAVCGPGVTPPDDPLLSQVSGWFWASPLGSGGAGTYRCWPGNKQTVDDYPTFNLIVRKINLEEIGGFDSSYWPGEDTKLSHDLVYKLGKKIIYDPKVLVYHQRRPVLVPHLKQLGRYGLHRGYFTRVLPKTSRRLRYYWPAIFTTGVIGGLLLVLLSLFLHPTLLRFLVFIYLACLAVYLIISLFNSLWVLSKCRHILVVLLLIPTTLISHVFYGLMFIKGLVKNSLTSKYSRDRL